MRYLTTIPALIFAGGVLLVSGVRDQIAALPRIPLSSIWTSLSSYKGVDVTVPEEERRIAGMSDYVFRSFGPDTSPLFSVYVGYYDRQVQGKSIHSPKNCLPGAGWEIQSSQHVRLLAENPAVSVNRVLLKNRGQEALVYYWYQGRGRVTASEYHVKWYLLRDAAMFGRTEEALVRVVVPIAGRSDSTRSRWLADADSLAISVSRVLETQVRLALPDAP
jgi:EpsI family protein